MTFSSDDLHSLANLFSLAGRLKRLYRQGWIDRGVDQPESVADHSWRLALMTLVLTSRDPTLDTERAVRLALVHDLPETLTGDVTPFDDRLGDPAASREALFYQLPEYSEQSERTKTAAEREAMQTIAESLPVELQQMLVDAWEEYEAGESPEARLVRQLDKLETWLQALEYQQADPELIIESFRKGTHRDVRDPDLRQLQQAIEKFLDTS